MEPVIIGCIHAMRAIVFLEPEGWFHRPWWSEGEAVWIPTMGGEPTPSPSQAQERAMRHALGLKWCRHVEFRPLVEPGNVVGQVGWEVIRWTS